MKVFFRAGIPGDGQDQCLKLEGHFCLFWSWLGNSVPIHPACPESPRLTVLFFKRNFVLCFSTGLNKIFRPEIMVLSWHWIQIAVSTLDWGQTRIQRKNTLKVCRFPILDPLVASPLCKKTKKKTMKLLSKPPDRESEDMNSGSPTWGERDSAFNQVALKCETQFFLPTQLSSRLPGQKTSKSSVANDERRKGK